LRKRSTRYPFSKQAGLAPALFLSAPQLSKNSKLETTHPNRETIPMSFIAEIEPLKQTALAELKNAPDTAALEQTKGAWIGPNGKFTALMKQLGALPKEARRRQSRQCRENGA
jgi:hypothetical protein